MVQALGLATTPRASQDALTVPSERGVQSLFTDTAPATTQQAAAAALFFKTHIPLKSWTATEWRKQPHSDTSFLTPEVTFLGRSNSGKSSLLNAILLNPTLCRVGPKPGKTTTMHAWALGPHDPKTKGAREGWQGDIEPKLTVLDMPGYGHGSQRDWGEEIMKYLTTRRQLRRAFVLVNPAHGMKKQDLQMLELLRRHTIPHQLIATKCDHDSVKRLPELLFEIQNQIKSHFGSGKAGPLLLTINDILAVAGLGDGQANKRVKASHMRGLSDVRWAVLRAAGLEEYAMALFANGGLPPKKKSAQAVQPATEDESKDEENIMAHPDFRSFIPRDAPEDGPNSEENIRALPETRRFTPSAPTETRTTTPATQPTASSTKAAQQSKIRSIQTANERRVPSTEYPVRRNPPTPETGAQVSEASQPPNIGIGIDELMAMVTTPEDVRRAKDKRMQTGGRVRGPRASRQRLGRT
ncbi:hypothetical protein PMZ80_003835 [Knufia obscura]|uniref:EngB-type G domain-containing protein n=1 Tax=Knufia obscura TaxID=1635080 RepID=A0ABR0RWD9_9EURO|nr:hypothetical protein PMZ80_003835 [Knufia obscura]